MSRVPVRRALLSVADKTGLAELAGALRDEGVQLVASEGTAAVLDEAGIHVTTVTGAVGHRAVLGGRVKTLHPKIHAAILARPDVLSDRADLQRLEVEPFQLVVVNLYPFAETVQAGAGQAEATEQIDIGGPAMIRAAAKNSRWVGVVTDPGQYEQVVEAIRSGGLDDELRRELAAEAFYRTAAYDAAILAWLEDVSLPERLVFPLRRSRTLRYGENPHQTAAAYLEEGNESWWASARILQGKPLSYNNLVDAEAAWRTVWEFDGPSAVVVKHTNPSGAAQADSLVEAFVAAWDCDPLSAFGSVVALNRPLDAATAEEMVGQFVEVVVCPALRADAQEILAGRGNLRVIEAHAPHAGGLGAHRVDQGFVVETRDIVAEGPEEWRVQTSRAPTSGETEDLLFAWEVAAHAKSNAVVIARDRAAVGVGAGDQSRVGAAERAVRQAGDRAVGGVAASDGFLPFRDGLDVLAKAGVTALIQPGGSRNDEEVIVAAEQHGLAMVFTGRRHFLH